MTPQFVFEKYFREIYSFHVHVDPTQCDLPQYLLNEVFVTLEIGASLPKPIQNLDVNENGFSCILSFRGVPEWVVVPWDAVFAIGTADGQGVLFKPVPGFHPATSHTDDKSNNHHNKKIEGKKSQNSEATVVSLADYKKRKGLA